MHLKITAEKKLFRQQFGSHISILKQEMFFKGSEVLFTRFLKKTIFYEFSSQVKFPEPWVLISLVLLQLSFHFVADPCYHYKNLSDANRKISYLTPVGSELCDNQLPEGWYRFVEAAGTKMPTTRVPVFRCGTAYSGWLDGVDPTVEEGEVYRRVCFSDRSTGCKYSEVTFVKNCESYFIYKLRPPTCNSRYCGTD